MALREILIHMDSTPQCAVRLELAVDLARRHGARLTGLYVLTYFPYASVNAYAGSQVEATRALFREQTDAAGIVAEWRRVDWPVVGVPMWEVITLHAYYTDLVVVGQSESDRKGKTALNDIPARVVLGSGRPVLIVPHTGSFSGMGRRILVAWKTGREATRAVNDALPLLRAAQEVTLMTVSETGAGATATNTVCDHLKLHGVPAVAADISAGTQSIATVLLNHATKQDFDLLVTGGYGYTAKGSPTLGVVARQLLQNMTIPIMMSH